MVEAEVARALRPGEGLSGVGVLVTCGEGALPVRGLRVRVSGSAIERGVVEVTRARARPFSARLLPWERASWEHGLTPEGEAGGVLSCELAGARVSAKRDEHGGEFVARPSRAKELLARAVWVEVAGSAVGEGEGELCVSVEPIAGDAEPVRAVVPLRVFAERAGEVVTAFARFAPPLVDRAQSVRALLDAFACVVAELPRGERVLIARGVAPDRAHLPAGCVVLGPRGLVGDSRWAELARRMSAGALELLALEPPGGSGARDEVLEASVACSSRYAPGPVEVALSVGRGLVRVGECDRVERAMERVVRESGAERAFAAWHGWVPSVRDAVREGKIGANERE